MILGYIDPGSGSVVLQMLIAGAIGCLAFFRGGLVRIFSSFKAKKDVADAPESAELPK